MTKPGSFRVSRLFRSGRLSFYGLAWAIRLFQSSNPRRNRRRVNDSGPESVSVSVDPVAAEELANLEYAEPVVNDPYALKYGLRFNPKWVLKPWSKWNYRWLAVISLAVIYNLLLIFPRAVYEQLEDDCGFRTTFTVLDYTCDFIYVCDMVASFLSGFLENGIVLREPRRLWHKYRTSSKTKLDILSLLPTDICFIFTGYRVPYPIVRINRLFRMHRLSEFIYRAETRSSSPILIRIGVLIAILAILTHINGCLYYFISAQIGIGSDVWVYPATARWRTNTTDHQQDTLWQKWSFCTYWSAMMLTSILPNMNNPTTTAEHIFHCAVILVGMLVFATIVARISRMILDINKKRDIFRSKEEGVKGYLQVHKVGADMDSRVTRWFNYIWSTKQDLDEESVLTLLPEKLRMEIARFVHISVLKQVKLFHELDEQFLEELVLKLRFQPFSPDDYICRKGDIGRQMYVVKRGKLNVVSDDGTKVFATLGAGTVFGELSILNVPGSKNGNRRTANVRAVGYADLFSLSKEDLWDSLKEYPAVQTSLLERAQQILQRDKLIDEEAAVQSKRLNRNFAEIANQSENSLEILEQHMTKFTQNYSTAFRLLTLDLEVLEAQMHQMATRQRSKQAFQRAKDSRRLRSAGDILIEDDAPFKV